MKIDCILTACNLNLMYIEFIPYFIKCWEKILPNVDIKIVLINDIIPNNYMKYKDYIILFKPIKNISDIFTSQYIRLLYPAILNYKNGILITDIDIVPLNSNYYIDNIKNIDNTKFINYNYNKSIFDSKQIIICYCVALSNIWSEIFKIKSLDDIKNRLINVFSFMNKVKSRRNKLWNKDQYDLYTYVINWNMKTNNFVHLDDTYTKRKRLCRSGKFKLNDDIKNKITNGEFTDYHCYRPMNKYNKINNDIINLVKDNDNDFISGENITELCDIALYKRNYIETYKNIKLKCKKIIYIDENINESVINIINNSYSFFIRSDNLKYFEKQIMPHIRKKFILVTHNSDLTVGKNKNIINNEYLVMWYGQNIIPHKKTTGIPIGLQNRQWKGWNYIICKKNFNNPKKKLLYFNFTINTNKKVRKNIQNILLKKGFCRNSKKNWNDYIKELSYHKFCISPPGNGIDCHRTWEAIYVGCIPIIKKNSIMYTHFKDLPILFVDNYNIITENFLEEYYNKFQNSIFCLKKSKLSYWKYKFIM